MTLKKNSKFTLGSKVRLKKNFVEIAREQSRTKFVPAILPVMKKKAGELLEVVWSHEDCVDLRVDRFVYRFDAEWIDIETPVVTERYIFRGALNLSHVILDAFKDGLTSFIVIGETNAIFGSLRFSSLPHSVKDEQYNIIEDPETGDFVNTEERLLIPYELTILGKDQIGRCMKLLKDHTISIKDADDANVDQITDEMWSDKVRTKKTVIAFK